ncbi:hypothetical protein [Salinispora fenicalii]|uniref:hypothetical protein n=1 Tax=Salinispora fenicalii TaxID=1137263 RepID=UPI000481B029|nr:hypothetical protein [Salinispora fenicalii]
MSRTIRRKHLLAGLAAAGVLGVGVAAPAMAMAADNTSPSPSASASASADAEKGTDKEQKRSDRQAAFAEALAEKLGVDVGEVTTALEELREQRAADRDEQGERPERGERGERPDAADRQEVLAQRLAQAVEDGKLTQEQADAITAAAEAGVLRGPGGHGGPGGSASK